MARFPEDAPAIIGLEGRGSRFASPGLSRTLISTRRPRGNEEMTPLDVRALSRLAGDRGEARAGCPSRPRFPSGWAVRVSGHRSGPRIVDSVLSEISTGFQAAVFTVTCSKYTASGVRRSSAV